MDLLPWHKKEWSHIVQRIKQQNLPHAMLLNGIAHQGKLQFAAYLAKSLLCHEVGQDLQPCNQCKPCALFEAHNNPDLKIVKVLEKKTQIGVDQIREIVTYLTLKPQYNRYRVVIIDPAESMNVNAANALLKALEEPPDNTFMALISSSPSRLPATINSRCQKLHFLPERSEMLEWLSMNTSGAHQPELLLDITQNAPFAAMALDDSETWAYRELLMEDFSQIINKNKPALITIDAWLKFGLQNSLYWLYGCFSDQLKLKLCKNPPSLSHPDFSKQLKSMAEQTNAQVLLKRLDKVIEATENAQGSATPQLLLEDVLIFCQNN